VPVSGADWSRLGANAERLAGFLGDRAFMRMTNGHCAALEIRSAQSGPLEFAGGVYADRPQVCRDLARGAAACAAEIELKAARVAALLRPAMDCPPHPRV
jgi:hypothetical protein